MTNKDIIREFIWFLIACGISTGVTVLFVQPRFDSLVTSILNADGLISDIAFKLRLLIVFLTLFPFLFLVTTIREITMGLKRRPQNIYLLFISFVSIVSSLVCLAFLQPIVTILFGSWTIYPPLSSLPHEFSPPDNIRVYYFSVISFLVLQIIMTIVTSRQVFKNRDATH
jgi:hypothetical protein